MDIEFQPEEMVGIPQRDIFALIALHALLSAGTPTLNPDLVSKLAVQHADDLIEKLNGEDKEDKPIRDDLN